MSSPLALSFEVAIIATILSGIVGVAAAALLATRRFIGRELVDAAFTGPLVLPPTVLGYYLLVMLGAGSPIGRSFEALTGHPIVFTPFGAVIAASVAALPLIVRTSRAAFDGVDERLVDAARTLGASQWRAFVTIRLPLARRGIVAGLSLGFARALGDFGITLMVAGNLPGRTQTAALAIYDAVQMGHDAEAAGLAALLFSIGLVILYLANRAVRAK